MDDRRAAILLATVTPLLAVSGVLTYALLSAGVAGAAMALLTAGIAVGAVLAFLPVRRLLRSGVRAACVLLPVVSTIKLVAAAALGQSLSLAGELLWLGQAACVLAGVGLVWLVNRRTLTRPLPRRV